MTILTEPQLSAISQGCRLSQTKAYILPLTLVKRFSNDTRNPKATNTRAVGKQNQGVIANSPYGFDPRFMFYSVEDTVVWQAERNIMWYRIGVHSIATYVYNTQGYNSLVASNTKKQNCKLVVHSRSRGSLQICSVEWYTCVGHARNRLGIWQIYMKE